MNFNYNTIFQFFFKKTMKKILIVQAVFYEHISKMLLDGAIAKIIENNFEYEVLTL